MSDIDFLANKKSADDQEPKNQAAKAEKIVWSEPDKDKPLVKEAPFSLLAFLNKKKADGKPALAIKPTSAPKPTTNQNKIKESRREILELIKYHDNSRLQAKKKPDKSLLDGFTERFKKPASHKEILIDYQQAINQEKIKRNPPAGQAGQIGQIFNVKLAKEKKPAAAQLVHLPEAKPARQIKSVKISGDSWLSRLMKLFKSGAPKIKPAKIVETAKVKEVSSIFNENKIRQIDQVFNVKLAKEKKPALARFVHPPEVPAKQVRAVSSVPPIKALAPKPAPEHKDSFLSRFFKMIKAKIAALDRPELRPIKNNLAGVMPKLESKISKPPLPKSIPEERKKIKVKPLEQKEPAQIKEKYPEVIKTNLIKGEIITFFDWNRKIVILINAMLIPVIFIAVIYFGLMYYEKLNQAKVEEQAEKISELTAEIKQTEVDLKEITDFQTRLKTVSQIFSKHIYWTNFFKFLEDQTIKDVHYAGFSGDTSGNYSLDAIALRFSNISEQVEVLRSSQKVTEVQAAGGEAVLDDAAKKSGVKFNLGFSILKSIFTE